MKYLLLVLAVIMTFTGCTSQKSAKNPGTEKVMKPEKNEAGEWELLVIDSQYDYFLTAHARPRSMYSESMLKSRNAQLVTEWNSMYYSGTHRNVIESYIEYDRNENYGFEFEYRLYQVFAYVNKRYGIRFSGLSSVDSFR